MKTYLPFVFVIVLLAGCAGTDVPGVVEPTPSPAPTATASPVPPSATPTMEVILPTETAAPEISNVRVAAIDGMPQVYIPAGTFRMGGMDARSAPDERPAHYVSLDAFWMDQLEVTNAMYRLCVATGPCTPPQNFRSSRRADYFNAPEFNDYPVVYVTWGQAQTYCGWAQRRLPSEAEWERAARGDDWRTFPWGEDKADGLLANFNMLTGDTSRVGTYPLGASPFGVLDMAGNVAEWTNDFYSGTYYATLTDEVTLNPTGPASSASLRRVVRGGSLGDAEINIRVPKRSSVLGSNLAALPGTSAHLGDVSPRIGFRCAGE